VTARISENPTSALRESEAYGQQIVVPRCPCWVERRTLQVSGILWVCDRPLGVTVA